MAYPTASKSPVEDIPEGSMPLLGHVEDFIGRTGAKITYGGKHACYRPGPDDIEMPARERFLSEVHLYSTVLHELGHYAVSRVMPHGRTGWLIYCLRPCGRSA